MVKVAENGYDPGASLTDGTEMQQQQQSYAGVTRRIVASLTMDRERTLRDMARVHADVMERSRGVAVRIGASADVPLGEAIDVEQTATLAAAASHSASSLS